MTHSSKRKGNDFERWLVSICEASGIPAKRAYASDGRSLGCLPTVDLKIADWHCQAKRRKKLPDYLQIPEGCDIVAVKQDRGEPMILLGFYDFLDLIKEAQYHASRSDETSKREER